jgi:precorrin-3B synthase
MASSQHEIRMREDACPGVLRLAEAIDGRLARIRLVGGFLSAQGIAALRDAAVALGDGRVELTSRGNLQLRGLAADVGVELGARLHAAGLWPSQSHERVRNIVASPLAGLDRPSDLTALVRTLDESLCATPRLAELSGRFLFAVDDGRGDVTGLKPDVLLQNGSVNGLRVSDPVAAAIAFANAFLDEREEQDSAAWRIADLVEGAARVISRVGGTPVEQAVANVAPPPAAGRFTRFDGQTALVVAVPLGRLNTDQLRWLADVIGTAPARVTPWRSIVLPNVDAVVIDTAGQLGFGISPDTPWSNVSSCSGMPGCAKAFADVQADARAELSRWPGKAVHWSGCDRRCGRSTRTEVDVIATGSGYVVEGI